MPDACTSCAYVSTYHPGYGPTLEYLDNHKKVTRYIALEPDVIKFVEAVVG